MLYVGRHNRSFFLLGLFTVWVLSPFVALLMEGRVSRRWPIPKPTLHALALLLSLASLAIYAAVAVTSPPKPAFWFLVVPFGSWLLLATVFLIAARRAGKRSPKGEP
jgi:hypothetical protein